jgi:hypothetical protein
MVSWLKYWRTAMNAPIAETKTEDSDVRTLTDIELDGVAGGWPSWRTTLLLIAIGIAFAA